ncbi:alanine racemase [Enterovirga sp.]|uniref:alanine racemase n=1 Tax=Enterovirga sp. TaxID=2026350 RepID=UPI002B577BE1|nr:alanine racemase [Enterovirga sp.]HMO28760.1 alanine racemase [Enterovirga sp.]
MNAPLPCAPATLTIDLRALAANWRLLQERAGAAECAGVVKADAYGIGIEPAVRALAAAGCRTFFVAHAGEAIRVRAALPDAPVYVLNGLLPGMANCLVEHGLRPVIGSFEELEDWAAASAAAGRPLPAALHVDTGMNRLGFPPDSLTALPSDPRLAAIEPALLMSHLTSADEPHKPATQEQIAAFEKARAILPALPASLSNSSGHFLDPVPAYDLTRPGFALYGGNPTPGRPNPMRPVVRLETRIVQIREIGGGEPVGYGGAWTARSRRRLATLSVGYADGYLRNGSATDGDMRDTGAALVAGRLCPLAGRVSMDLIVVDVTEVPESEAQRGSAVTLIGDTLDVDEVGRRAGTIGYEILTSLGRRYARRYLGLEEEAPPAGASG